MLLILLSIFHSLFGKVSYYSIKTLNALARVECGFELLFVVYRLLLGFLYFFTLKFKLEFWYLFTFHCLSMLFFLKYNYEKLLYYHPLISKTFNYCTFLYFGILLSSLIFTLTTYKEPTIILLFFGIAMIPTSYSYITYREKQILIFSDYTKFVSNPYESDKYLKLLMRLIHTPISATTVNPILSGITQHHYKECHYDKCLLYQKQLFFIPYLKKFISKEDYTHKVHNYDLIFVLCML